MKEKAGRKHFQTASCRKNAMNLSQTFSLHQKNFRAYAPANPPADTPLVLTFLPPHEADEAVALLSDGLILLSLDEADWEYSFTPHPAPRLFKKAADFGGGASEYLAWLAVPRCPKSKAV
ncbi:hypothetical protein [Kingella potus]|uniref:hypothetical protein n=1 Tax=Kingella potus TaxID=265175 RepID=UPI001FD1F945|nr:hypothetical protein [Kingella potus]UOP00386.1 hypothetical protein LVJ84_10915 [Kingella potus]